MILMTIWRCSRVRTVFCVSPFLPCAAVSVLICACSGRTDDVLMGHSPASLSHRITTKHRRHQPKHPSPSYLGIPSTRSQDTIPTIQHARHSARLPTHPADATSTVAYEDTERASPARGYRFTRTDDPPPCGIDDAAGVASSNPVARMRGAAAAQVSRQGAGGDAHPGGNHGALPFPRTETIDQGPLVDHKGPRYTCSVIGFAVQEDDAGKAVQP